MGKALHKYDMIHDGDRILVGVSGGKDSLTLAWMLKERQTRIPIRYELFPVFIDRSGVHQYSSIQGQQRPARALASKNAGIVT